MECYFKPFNRSKLIRKKLMLFSFESRFWELYSQTIVSLSILSISKHSLFIRVAVELENYRN